jgi:hypothetical protein
MEDRVWKILFLSVCVVIWWVCLWGLFEEPIQLITKGRMRLRMTIYASILVLMFFTLAEHPEIFESF